MSVNDKITLRRWEEAKYHDPVVVLARLRRIGLDPRVAGLRPEVRELRTNDLKRDREGRQVALLCHGMAAILGTRVCFSLDAVDQDDPADAVACWQRGVEGVFTPVQVKEARTPNDVDSVIASLTKYRDRRLAVGIHVSGEGRVDAASLHLPDLEVGSVCLFGAVSKDQSTWFIHGNLLQDPQTYFFDYPCE